MYTDKTQIIEAVYQAIDALNQTLPKDERLDKSPETKLRDSLNSLSLVNLIIETELAIEQEYGKSINLANQATVDAGAGVLEDVGSFSEFVQAQVNEENEF
ncbi:MAG: hypothetical protein GF372_14095 [Candidatus Marinimicrobia bacterium]|nr:hypothetical protein [Candidatus Neomarinimicrobiota bacterium]